jgi:hypothetical protein
MWTGFVFYVDNPNGKIVFYVDNPKKINPHKIGAFKKTCVLCGQPYFFSIA